MTYIINELLGPFVIFTITGLVFWTVILYSIAKETVRAMRQSHRIATVHIRLRTLRRRPSIGLWIKCFSKEFYSSYSQIRIGYVELDHNPNIKAKPWR